jgi:Raf kinase inhibitor-like YbhB/YbcL family protein
MIVQQDEENMMIDGRKMASQAVAVCAIIAIALALGLAAFGADAQTFALSSPDIKPDELLATKFTANVLGCKGDNLSPALRWENPPQGTKSYALMVHDPDAVTGGAGIWHWVILDIPASASGIEQGAGTVDGARLPAGSRQIVTDYGTPGWGGPCPPAGQAPHHYNFTLYALKVEKLELPPTATASHAGFIINRNSLAQARLTATYGRKQ